MRSITDDRGYNQIWVESEATRIRGLRRALMIVEAMTTISPEQTVLEIGCGTGRGAHYVAKKTGTSVLGIDLCQPFIEKAKETYQLPNLRFEALNFNQQDELAGKKFNYIIGNGILHHLYYYLDETLLNI